MGKHELLYSQDVYNANQHLPFTIYCCIKCACTFTKKTWEELPCPPWQSTDKGDTKAERVGGDIHVLLQIQSSMREVKPLLAFKVNKEIAFRWNQAADALEQLIKKHEGKL